MRSARKNWNFALCLLLTGCGSSSFSGDAGNLEAGRQGQNKPQSNSPLTAQSSALEENGQKYYKFNADAVFDNSADGQALKACFAEWGETPFNEQTAKAYKKLTSKSKGFGSKNISDRARTREPALILVDIQAIGFSSYRVDLGNSNGWYCIKSNAEGFSSFDYLKHCRAQIGNMQDEAVGFSQNNFTEYGDDC